MSSSVAAAAPAIGRYRWVICALLFFGTTINYVDRQVLGILARDLQREIGWTELQYGNIVAAFSAAYAIGLLLAGRLMDRFGVRTGYAVALTLWSIAGMVTALARTPLQFGFCRALLGLAEAGNFPAAIKGVAEWFPKKERALATGIFNAGTNVGAVVAPLTVPWIAINFGWQWAFVLTGAIGFMWLTFWLPMYRTPEHHPRLSKAELAFIQSDPADPPGKTPWVRLIPHRQASAFAIAKYMTDPIWWFYLFWTPNFLRDVHKLDLSTIPLPLIVIYLIADVGSVGGGWLSSSFIKRGWAVGKARKIAMLICALLVTPVLLVPRTESLWIAVLLIGLAAAAHQGWSANVYTLVSDSFPRQAVGSVVGIGGMAGAVGGVMLAVVTGVLLQLKPGDYTINFLIAGSIYLITLGVIHLLVPQLTQVDVDAPVKPISLGTIVGFGFVGEVFGTFTAWIVGLVNAAGPAMLTYLAIGAGIGGILGIIAGIAIANRQASQSRRA
ncbi:MAG TPA: MFS transporter [Vicinamibacterales bacterium]|jgi:ACS family hexuronate transporter-like MFS transporter|nr:MFS transporter [Vicinamibacterales bacterium]